MHTPAAIGRVSEIQARSVMPKGVEQPLSLAEYATFLECVKQ